MLWLGAFAIAFGLAPSDPPSTAWYAGALYVVPVVVASALLAAVTRRCRPEDRRFYASFLVFVLVTLAVDVVWTVAAQATGQTPTSPWIEDIGLLGYLALVPVVIEGFRPQGRLRLSLAGVDAAIVTGSVGLAGYIVLLEPLVDRGASTTSLFGAAYALLDLVVVVLFVPLVLGLGRPPRGAWLFVAAFAAAAVADGSYGYFWVAKESVFDTWFVLCYQAQFVLLALGGFYALRHGERLPRPSPRARDLGLPFAIGGICLVGSLLAAEAVTRRLGATELGLVAALSALMLGRMLLAEHELRLAERSARTLGAESEQRFREIFEHSALAIVLVDAEFRAVAANPAAAVLFGRSGDEIVELGLDKLAHPDDVALDRDLSADLLAGRRRSYTVDKRYLGRDGSVVWGRLTYSLGRAGDGGPPLGIAMIEDVTASRAAADDLRLAEERWRTLLANVQEVLMVIDPGGRFVYASHSIERWLGYRPEELVGTSAFGLVHLEDVGRVHDTFVRVLGGSVETVDYRVRHKNGSWRTFEALGVDRSDDPLVGGVLVSARDLSDQVALAREREQIEFEHRVSQRLEAVGQLAAGIAHEINTPIQFVGDSAHFLGEAVDDLRQLLDDYRDLCSRARDLDPDEIERRLAEADAKADLAYLDERIPTAFTRLLDGTERVTSIVKAMKSFAHPPDSEMMPADLNEALRTTLTVCRNEYKYLADLALDLGELPPVTCNVGDLNQVFLNLIVNAAHAIADVVGGTGDRGTIRLRSRLDGPDAVIEISDDGPGIPEEIRERIYEPFFTTKEVGRGTGQGLAIARTIVERHSGSLSFTTGRGKGTSFTIRIPVDPAIAA